MRYSVEWIDDHVRVLNQRLLPGKEQYLDLFSSDEVAAAICDMTIRGAPAIGVAAAYGIVLAARNAPASERVQAVEDAIGALGRTRPTAVNLFAALKHMRRVLDTSNLDHLVDAMLQEAVRLHDEEISSSITISRFGASLIPEEATVLTHCNAGMIATAAHGTAVGAMVEAYTQGKLQRAIATETRPLLQGARLTVWELARAGVPTVLITDSMVGHFMRTTHIDCVMVGADRIAANGDVANKIGTYAIAVLAKAHRIPFYVTAPCSTIDGSIRSGDQIEIEERSETEVTALDGRTIAANGASVRNPAFDVTPHRFVTAIVTERGILRAPYTKELRILTGHPGGRRK